MGGGGMKSPKQMMKKLRKLWSKKKVKKNKDHQDSQRPYSYYYCHYQQQHQLIIPPPPLPSSTWHSQYHHCSTPEPSAPPLPPWLVLPPEPEDLHVSAPTIWLHSSAQIREEISTSTSSPPCVNVSDYHQDTISSEPHLDPNPVYGVPVDTNSVTTKRRSEVFVSFGFNLISCLFPCFRIPDCKEERKKLLQ